MQFSKSDIEKWSQSFDILKYPIRLYDELVWNNKNNPEKLALLGGWKTGCIRINNNTDYSAVYIDENGNRYEYTKRWSPKTPVGYDVWKKISKDEANFVKKIPVDLGDKKPKVLSDLEKEKGFGFVWGIFVLHCIYPKTYPLYDQHVYRAYEAIQSDEEILSKLAPASWDRYLEYTRFFKNLVENSGIDERVTDRALWTYGKHLKVPRRRQKVQNNIVKSNAFVFKNYNSDDYCLSFTLGGKEKSFWWKFDKKLLTITRRFKTKLVSATFSESEVDAIQRYIGNQEIPLANNVKKLNSNTEKEGLGKFIYCILGKNTTEAQLASHIAAIFVASGIWKWNGKKRNMTFIKEDDDWRNSLSLYYLTCLISDNNLPFESVLE